MYFLIFFCDAYSSVLTSFEYLLPISYKYIIITLCCIVVLWFVPLIEICALNSSELKYKKHTLHSIEQILP